MTNVNTFEDRGISVEELKVRLEENQVKFASVRKDVRWLYKNRNKLNFDLAIQRNGVWKDDRCSLLIQSAMLGLPIPTTLANKTPEKIHEMLDGKQRALKALIGFVDGRYALTADTPDVFGFEVAGLTFQELPECLQEAVLNAEIFILEMENLDDELRETLFYRWNNGMPLTKMELTRAMAGTKVIEQLGELKALEFFDEFIAVSDTQKNRFVDEELIAQIMSILTGENYNFSGDNLRDYIVSKKEAGIDAGLMENIKKISQYMFNSFAGLVPKNRKAILKKVNTPILFVMAEKAMERNISDMAFANWAERFLVTNYKSGGDYGRYCSSGSAKETAVKGRLEVMGKNFEESFADIAKAEEIAKKEHEEKMKRIAEEDKKKAEEKAEKEKKKAEEKAEKDKAKAEEKAKTDEEKKNKEEEEAKAKAEEAKKKTDEKARKQAEKEAAKKAADEAKQQAEKQVSQQESEQQGKESASA